MKDHDLVRRETNFSRHVISWESEFENMFFYSKFWQRDSVAHQSTSSACLFLFFSARTNFTPLLARGTSFTGVSLSSKFHKTLWSKYRVSHQIEPSPHRNVSLPSKILPSRSLIEQNRKKMYVLLPDIFINSKRLERSRLLIHDVEIKLLQNATKQLGYVVKKSTFD